MNADNLAAAVRAAIQAILDASDDPGWQVAQFVICMGLERVTADGELDSTAWLWTPPRQAEWMTDGLLESATDLRMSASIDDD